MTQVSANEQKRRQDAAYQAHRREQLQHIAQIPFAQKLIWLEEAHHFVLQLQQKNPHLKAMHQKSRGETAPQSTLTEEWE